MNFARFELVVVGLAHELQRGKVQRRLSLAGSPLDGVDDLTAESELVHR